MTPFVVAVVAAVLMEPVAAVLHRLLMHGPGWGWHRSHHAPPAGRLERNDLYPVVFAAGTVAAMAAGSAVASFRPLLWAGAGVTAYGLAYLVVHDLGIHERAGRVVTGRGGYLGWVRDAHAVHHRTGGAPYGFLVPVVPADRRGRPPGRGAGTKAAATVRTFSGVDTRARRANTS